ncbi:MAG: hypothetical protein OXB98_15155 [Bryobacterales bacterium]|nr:hypothetical protein [Bryobacterales bacterium]
MDTAKLEPTKEEKLDYVRRQIAYNEQQLKARSADLAVLLDWLRNHYPDEHKKIAVRFEK